MMSTKSFVLLAVQFFLLWASGFAQQQTVGLFKNQPGAFSGYTLFTPRLFTTTYLIDMAGRLVHSWENTRITRDAMLLENGLLLRTVDDSNNCQLPCLLNTCC